MLVFLFFLRINLTINVAHPVFLMHTQSLLSGYAPGVNVSVFTRTDNCILLLRSYFFLSLSILVQLQSDPHLPRTSLSVALSPRYLNILPAGCLCACLTANCLGSLQRWREREGEKSAGVEEFLEY